MTNIKTLALAAVTVLTIGGTAMAQEGPIVSDPSDWAATPQVQTTYHAASVVQSAAPQAGSSDISPVPVFTYQQEQAVAAAGGGN